MSNRVVREDIIALLSILEGKHSLFFGGSKITADGDAVMKLEDTCSLEQKLSPTETAY